VRGDEPSDAVAHVFGERARVPGAFHGDAGSAARFFYCAKADRADRDEGLDHRAKKPLLWSSGEQNPGAFQSPNTDRSARNHHPTVKPTDLMRYLVRLVTRPGGTVLDPFTGSGSTGKAALLEGMSFVGIEREAEYVEIARDRIRAVAPLFAEAAE
jgi:site-specific DNA-methyltransferase (adenine-specific)